jgi:threonine dehydrogenase-like Zn-dependent dehydrogenase
MLGAGRVIVIDRVPERLAMARTQGRAEQSISMSRMLMIH